MLILLYHDQNFPSLNHLMTQLQKWQIFPDAEFIAYQYQDQFDQPNAHYLNHDYKFYQTTLLEQLVNETQVDLVIKINYFPDQQQLADLSQPDYPDQFYFQWFSNFYLLKSLADVVDANKPITNFLMLNIYQNREQKLAFNPTYQAINALFKGFIGEYASLNINCYRLNLLMYQDLVLPKKLAKSCKSHHN